MKRILIVLGALGLVVVTVIVLAPSPRPAPPPGFVRVTKVDDGDTIEADVAGHHERIRLMGVDTPETVDPRRPVQCFGREASHHTKATLTNQAVRLEVDPVAGDRDKYHRLLRYVYLQDGSSYNESLIREGFAHEYTYRNQHYAHQIEFKSAEQEARTAGRGFWNSAACNGDTKRPA